MKSLGRVRLFATPWTVAYRLLRPWDFPGKSTGVGCHFLFQGVRKEFGIPLTSTAKTKTQTLKRIIFLLEYNCFTMSR